MYQLAKSTRAKLKNKARQMAASADQKVDSSDWTPSKPLNADVKTGMRPISRRAYKKGGKVMGECDAPRADRKPRKAGGRNEATAMADAKVNRNVKSANEEREGIKHIGGMKKGGPAKRKGRKDGGLSDFHDEDAVPNPNRGRDEAMKIMRSPKPEDDDISPAMAARMRGIVDSNAASSRAYEQNKIDRKAFDTRGYKKGGPAKKMMGGPMMGSGPQVDPKRFNFSGNPVTPGQKSGGKVDLSKIIRNKKTGKISEKSSKHEDVKEDKALIKKMIKSSAMKKADGGNAEGKNWIQSAIKHPGALRKSLHVKKGQNIPEGKLEKAEHSKNPTMRHRAQLAENLKHMKHADGGTAGALGGLLTSKAIEGNSPASTSKLVNGLTGQKKGGRIKRKTGGGVFTGPGYPGKVPGVVPGGRTAHAGGGKAGKGKTNINIVVAGNPQGDDAGMPPKGMTPQMGQRMPIPAPAPAPAGMPPMPMGGPPPMPPMPMPMPPQGPAQMGPAPRKSGGRLTKIAHSYKDMEAGAGGGEGRLQKTDIAKSRMGRKVGGRAYHSYKDMDDGAGSGRGRLEKAEIQRTK